MHAKHKPYEVRECPGYDCRWDFPAEGGKEITQSLACVEPLMSPASGEPKEKTAGEREKPKEPKRTQGQKQRGRGRAEASQACRIKTCYKYNVLIDGNWKFDSVISAFTF